MRVLTLIIVVITLVATIAVVSTRTTSAASSTVSGTVQLQAISGPIPSAISVTLTLTLISDGSTSTVATDSSGDFSFNGVTDGTYALTAKALGFVVSETANFVLDHAAYTMPTVQLRAGLVTPDGVVSILDISAVAASFGQSIVSRVDGLGRVVDLNADGVVNILDISAVANNFGAVSPLIWSGTIGEMPLPTATAIPGPTATPSPSPPGAPQNVQVEAGPGFATVTWDPPANSGGTAITEYAFTWYRNGFVEGSAGTAPATARMIYMTCCNDDNVSYTVKATNAFGTGPESANSNMIDFGDAPYAVDRPGVTIYDGKAGFTWSEGTLFFGASPATHVMYKTFPDARTKVVRVSEANSSTEIQLDNDTSYHFGAIAINEFGAAQSVYTGVYVPMDPAVIPPPRIPIEFPFDADFPDPLAFDSNAFVIRECGTGPFDLFSGSIPGLRLGGCELKSRFIMRGGDITITLEATTPGDAFLGWNGMGFRLDQGSGNVDVEVGGETFSTSVPVPNNRMDYRLEWSQGSLRAYVDDALVLDLSESVPWEYKIIEIGQHDPPEGLSGFWGVRDIFVSDVAGVTPASVESVEVQAANSEITILDDPLPFAASWGSNGVVPETFREVTDMTFGPDGLIYVGSKQSNYQSYKPDGTFQERMWRVGTSTGEFLSIDGLAFAPNGNMYIVDTLAASVTVLSPDGTPIDRWGSSNVPYGLMITPSDIAISSSGDVYVADNDIRWIHHFNLDGDHLGSWPTGNGTIGHPWSARGRLQVAVDSTGNVYAESLKGLDKYTDTGVLLNTWTRAELGMDQGQSIVDIAVDSSDNFYIVDTGEDHIKKYSSTGTLLASWAPEGSADGELDNPLTMAIDQDDRVFVYDRTLGTITVFGDPLPNVPLPTATPTPTPSPTPTPIPQPTPIAGALQETFAARPEPLVISLWAATNR